MSKLGEAQRGATPSAKATAMAAALSGAQHFEDIHVTIAPGRVVVAKQTLVGSARLLDIEGQVVRAMAELGLEQTELTQNEYELERERRVLSAAVRDPANPTESFGTVEEWGALPPEFVVDAWRQYSDMREAADPASVPLTELEREALRDAVAKKNSILLRGFGARKLAHYLLTSDAQPASSPTPTSTAGDSSAVT